MVCPHPPARGGDLPDRVGPARVGAAAALVESIGLATITFAYSLPVALLGALAMGAAFSLLYPSLSLIVIARTPETRRGAALGTFTAFFVRGRSLRGADRRRRRGADKL